MASETDFSDVSSESEDENVPDIDEQYAGQTEVDDHEAEYQPLHQVDFAIDHENGDYKFNGKLCIFLYYRKSPLLIPTSAS